MSFFVNESSIRGGNRGGQGTFNWDDVRLKNYKDRDGYLGGSTKLGYLDRGHKWKNNDWWMKESNTPIKITDNELNDLKNEIEKVKQLERNEMDNILSGKANNDKNELSEFELKKILQKGVNQINECDIKLNGLSKNENKEKIQSSSNFNNFDKISGTEIITSNNSQINNISSTDLYEKKIVVKEEEGQRKEKKKEKSIKPNVNKYIEKYKEKESKKHKKKDSEINELLKLYKIVK